MSPFPPFRAMSRPRQQVGISPPHIQTSIHLSPLSAHLAVPSLTFTLPKPPFPLDRPFWQHIDVSSFPHTPLAPGFSPSPLSFPSFWPMLVCPSKWPMPITAPHCPFPHIHPFLSASFHFYAARVPNTDGWVGAGCPADNKAGAVGQRWEE